MVYLLIIRYGFGVCCLVCDCLLWVGLVGWWLTGVG